MSKYSKKIQNILLALGILFFLVGVLMVSLPPIGEMESYHLIFNAVFLLITALMVYFSLLARKTVVFYISLNLCIISLLLLILTAHAVPLSFKQCWPVIVIVCGITLFPVGRIRYKEFRLAYVFPAAALTILGVFFMLFTFKIIKVPMRIFFKNFFPIFLILSGTFLIVLYYLRQNTKEIFHIIKDEEKYADDDDVYHEDDE